ncbi:hypothetical protein DIPPA_12778 [Diplonema papillatum]|nr:hypothetical protein DIPPA_12778 [Diplonema papillatum]
MSASQQARRKRREEREQHRERDRLRGENDLLREHVERIAETGEEHRHKVEDMFLQAKVDQERLEARLARLESERVLLQKEAAETGGQLRISRTAQRELAEMCEYLERTLVDNTRELSDLAAQVAADSAEYIRMNTEAETAHADLIAWASEADALKRALAAERSLLQAARRENHECARQHASYLEKASRLKQSARIAEGSRAQAAARIAELAAEVARVEEETVAFCDKAVVTLRCPLDDPPLTPPRSVRSIPPEEADEKRQAFIRAQELKANDYFEDEDEML